VELKPHWGWGSGCSPQPAPRRADNLEFPVARLVRSSGPSFRRTVSFTDLVSADAAGDALAMALGEGCS